MDLCSTRLQGIEWSLKMSSVNSHHLYYLHHNIFSALYLVAKIICITGCLGVIRKPKGPRIKTLQYR